MHCAQARQREAATTMTSWVGRAVCWELRQGRRGKAVDACAAAGKAIGGFLMAFVCMIWAALWAAHREVEDAARLGAHLRYLADLFGSAPLLASQRRLAAEASQKNEQDLLDMERGLEEVGGCASTPFAAVPAMPGVCATTSFAAFPAMPGAANEVLRACADLRSSVEADPAMEDTPQVGIVVAEDGPPTAESSAAASLDYLSLESREALAALEAANKAHEEALAAKREKAHLAMARQAALAASRAEDSAAEAWRKAEEDVASKFVKDEGLAFVAQAHAATATLDDCLVYPTWAKEMSTLDNDEQLHSLDGGLAAATASVVAAADSVPMSPCGSGEPRCLEFFVGTPGSPHWHSPSMSCDEEHECRQAPQPPALPLAGQLARAAIRKLVDADKSSEQAQEDRVLPDSLDHAFPLQALLSSLPTPSRCRPDIAAHVESGTGQCGAMAARRTSMGSRVAPGLRSAQASRGSSAVGSRVASAAASPSRSATSSRCSSGQPVIRDTEACSHNFSGGRLQARLEKLARSRPNSPAPSNASVNSARMPCQRLQRGIVGSSVGSSTSHGSALPRWR